jgi:hypothetical protein
VPNKNLGDGFANPLKKGLKFEPGAPAERRSKRGSCQFFLQRVKEQRPMDLVEEGWREMLTRDEAGPSLETC